MSALSVSEGARIPIPRSPQKTGRSGAESGVFHGEQDTNRALLAALADGYAYTVDGVIQDVNDALCRLTGYRRDELLGVGPPFPFWPSESVDAGMQIVDKLRAADGGQVDFEFQRKDGSRFLAWLTVRPVYTRISPDGTVPLDVTPTGYVTIISDVTAARAEEQALLDTQRLLYEAQAQAKLGSWTIDTASGVVTFSPQMLALCGLPPDAPAPDFTAFFDLVHPDDRPSYRQLVVDTLRDGTFAVVEHRLLLPDGTVRHIYGTATVERDPITARAVTIRGTAQDVTERVLREQALAASEERFRLALAHSPIGVALVGLDGQWLDVNEALCRIVGYSREELLGGTFQDMTHPDDLTADLALMHDLLDGRRHSFQLDKRYRHADGHVVWVSLHVAIVRTADGAPLHFVSQVIDITARRAATAALATQATTDALTGLGNRRHWDNAVNALREAGTEGLAIAIIDLDRFKRFNDTHGHLAGDQLLIDAAKAWSAVLVKQLADAVLVRLGGEEFGVAMSGVDARDARKLVQRLIAATPEHQTASAGVTLACPGDDLRALVTRADAALYAAKRGGRNRCDVLLDG